MASRGRSKSNYQPVPTHDTSRGDNESDDETLFEVNRDQIHTSPLNESYSQGQIRRIARKTGAKIDKDDIEDEEEEQTFTVEEAVEAIGLGWFQLKIYIVCGIISASDALEMMLLAVLSPVVRCEWYLSDAQVAFVTMVVFIGMGISAPTLGYCGDKFGRKFTLFLATLSIGYYGLLTTLSPSYYWLLILRGLVGCGMGGSPQGVSLLSEYIPRKYRAKLLIFSQIFWAGGVMFEILLASIIVPKFGWRWLLAGSAVPSLLSALGLLFVPESARYLIAAGNRQKAVQILADAARLNKSKLPAGHLYESPEIKRGQFSNLFTPEYRRSTFQLWILWFGFAFFYYGMVLAGAEILRKFNPDGTEQKCHCSHLSSKDYVTMILSTLGEFVCLPVNLILIDWVGRRLTAATNMFVAGALVSFLQVDMSRATFTILLFALRGFSSAFGNLIYIYSSEIYPTTVRTLGMGTASAWARIGAMTTPLVAQVLLSHSISLASLVYASVCFICSLDAFFLPIETKERDLPQSVSMDLIIMKDVDVTSDVESDSADTIT